MFSVYVYIVFRITKFVSKTHCSQKKSFLSNDAKFLIDRGAEVDIVRMNRDERKAWHKYPRFVIIIIVLCNIQTGLSFNIYKYFFVAFLYYECRRKIFQLGIRKII